MQSVYPGVSVDFSCRAEGFSMLSYSWFVVASGDNNGMQIMNENVMMYTIADPMYGQNATGYYCIASNNEGIAVSDTSMLTGNQCCVVLCSCSGLLLYVEYCLPILYLWLSTWPWMLLS